MKQSKAQSLAIRKNNLEILTNLTFLFAVAVKLSVVLPILRYLLHGSIIDFALPNYALIPRVWVVNGFVYGFVSLAVTLGLCIWGIKGKAKNALHIKIGLGIILAMFLLEISGDIESFMKLGTLNPSQGYTGPKQILYVFFTILPVLICFRANLVKPGGKERTINTGKRGFGGFFVLLIIRNIVTTALLVMIGIALVNANTGYPLKGAFFGRVLDATNVSLAGVYLLMMVVYFIATVKMFRKSAAFVPYIIGAESMAVFTLLYKITNVSNIDKLMGSFAKNGYTDIVSLVAAALLIVYYATSGRVWNTFLMQSDVPQESGAAAAPEQAAAPLPAVKAVKKAVSQTQDVFYAFAAQGPAIFGQTADDALIREKALKVQNDCENGSVMQLELVKPHMWGGKVNGSSSGGMVQVSYSIDRFIEPIRAYLQNRNVPNPLIDRGIELSRKQGLQLTNPGSGLFVIGVPIIRSAAQGKTIQLAKKDE